MPNDNLVIISDILAGEAVMAPFDQPMLGAPTYAFRTNGFPTAAITRRSKRVLERTAAGFESHFLDWLPAECRQQVLQPQGCGWT